jgi:hypothetical protein
VGAEDAQELIQDSIAIAAKLMHSVEQAGKKVTPGNIAYYTIQHIKSGRRSTGSSVVDVHGSATQSSGKTRLSSLDEVVPSNEECGGEIFTFNDVLSNDQEDPGTKAARKMDWESFLTSLSARDRHHPVHDRRNIWLGHGQETQGLRFHHQQQQTESGGEDPGVYGR